MNSTPEIQRAVQRTRAKELETNSIEKELECKSAVAFLLSDDFFTELRCVKTLKVAHRKVQEYYSIPNATAKGRAERLKFKGPRQIIFLLDEEQQSKEDLIEHATTQDSVARRTRDGKVGNANLVRDILTQASRRRRDSDTTNPVASGEPRAEGVVLHKWLQDHLSALLANGQQGRVGKDGALTDARYPGYPVVPLYTDAHRNVVTLKRVVQEALYVAFDGETKWNGQAPNLYIPQQLQDRTIKLPKATKKVYRLVGTKDIRSGRQGKFMTTETAACDVTKHLYISRHHPLCDVLERKLRHRLDNTEDYDTAKLQISTNSTEIVQCSHMLVVFAKKDGAKQNSAHALDNERYLVDIERAQNLGLTFITLGVGKDLNVAPFMQSARMQKVGLADAARIIPCPECVTGDAVNVAREDNELEKIALACVGLELDQGIRTVPHKRTVKSIRDKAFKEIQSIRDKMQHNFHRPRWGSAGSEDESGRGRAQSKETRQREAANSTAAEQAAQDSTGAGGLAEMMMVEVEVPEGQKLGFSLTGGSPSTIHELVRGGAAASAGVTGGSALVRINGADVSDKPCHECAGVLEASARPVVLTFRVGSSAAQDPGLESAEHGRSESAVGGGSAAKRAEAEPRQSITNPIASRHRRDEGTSGDAGPSFGAGAGSMRGGRIEMGSAAESNNTVQASNLSASAVKHATL